MSTGSNFDDAAAAFAAQLPGPDVLRKGEDEDEDPPETDDDNDKDDDKDEADEDAKKEEDEGNDASKSIDQGDLMKALEALEAAAAGTGGTADRRAYLAKAFGDGTITPDEHAEMASMATGEAPEFLHKSFAELAQEDEALVKGFEVSAFLEAQNLQITSALDEVREQLAKSEGRREAFDGALVKSFRAMAEAVEGMTRVQGALAQRLGVLESQPLPRRAMAGGHQPLNKAGFGAGADGGEPLTKAQISQGLNNLLHKTAATGFRTASGLDVGSLVTAFEVDGPAALPAALIPELRAALRG